MKYIRAALTFAMFVALTACGGGGGSAGNTSGAALFTTAASKITIVPGEVQTYSIGGGVPGYAATSNSSNVVVSVDGRSLVITGKAGGEATLTVTDASGAKVTIVATVGTGVPFNSTAPNEITVNPGGKTSTFNLVGGSGSYSASSSNIQVATVTQSGSQFYITGVSAGTATVSVADSVGATKSISVTVGSNNPLFTTAPDTISVNIGSSTQSFDISGGTLSYTVASSDSQVASVKQTGASFVVTGLNAGSATVRISDTSGASKTISVTVAPLQPLFTTAPAQISVGIGANSAVFAISGGNPGYSVVSSNPQVASVAFSDTTFVVTGQAAGSAVISVSDRSGATKLVQVQVAPLVPLFTTAPDTLTIGIGATSVSYSIGGGTQSYVVLSSDQSIATVTQVGSTFFITGVKAGQTNILVTDSSGASKRLTLTVGSNNPLFTTAPDTMNVGIGVTSQSFTIGGGTQSYVVISSDQAIATVSQVGSTFFVTGVSAGIATILITDTAGANKRISLTVGSTQPLFTTAPSDLAIGVGATTGAFTISGGNPAYVVTSNNQQVATVTQIGTQFTVTGRFPGIATLNVSDRSGNSKLITVTVRTAVLFTTAPDSVTVDVGSKSSTYSIDGGSLSYSVSTSNLNIASVSQIGNQFFINGVSAGTAAVVITDTAGTSKRIDVTVGVGTPLRTTLPSELTMSVGQSADSFAISGGAPAYTVTSNNKNVVTVVQNGVQFQVTPVNAGKAVIVVQDSQGTQKTTNVTVSAVDLFTTAPASINLPAGGTSASFKIGGGAPSYNVTTSNSQVAQVSLNGSSFSIAGLTKGTATISIFDSVGAVKRVEVTVGSSVALFTTAPTSLDLGIGATSTSFDIGGGDPSYVVSTSNTQIATVSYSLNKFTVTGVASGKAIISVTDSFGQRVLINVNVTSGSDLYTTAPTVVNIGVGLDSSTYLIGGGSKIYTVASGNSAVVAVVQNGNQFFLKGLTLGAARVSITDTLGATKSIDVNVVNGLQLFTTAPAAMTVGVGVNSATYSISGGTPGYSVATSNASVVTVTQVGSQFYLTGVLTGKATVVITDSVGGSKSIDVTVSTGSDLFTNAGTDVSVGVGVTTPAFQIGGGSLTYSVSTANAAVATIALQGNTFTITGLAIGRTSVFVTDSLGASKKIDVVVGSPVDLFLTSPSDLTIGIGVTSPFYQVGGGTAPYAVASSNPQIFTASLTGNQFRVVGVSAGKANLLVTDAKGATKTVSVTVGSGIDLFTTAPTSVIVAINASSTTYTIGGGSEVYSVSSSDDKVVTIGQNTNKEFVITGKAGGKAVVSVKDSAGKEVKIDVIVGTADAMFTTSAPDIALDVGGANTFKIGGGTGVYSVGSSNTAVAQASVTGNNLLITAVGSGKATIVVRDTTSGSVTITVNVGSLTPIPLFTTAGSDIVVAPSASPTFVISGGKAPYAVTSSNPSVVTASVNGNTLTVNGVAAGASRINVTDSAGTAVLINATVNAGTVIPLYTTTPASITIAKDASATYVIAGGTAPYTVTSSNVAILTSAVAGSSFTITGVAPGDTQITIQDSLGATITRAVTVSPVVVALLDVLPGTATGSVGDTLTFKIVGGSPSFTLTNNNPSIASVTPTTVAAGGTFAVTLLNVGTTDIVVLDSQGVSKKVTITATASNSNLRISPSALTVGEDSTNSIDLTVYGGTGPYRAFTSDLILSSVPAGTITQTAPGTTFTTGLGSQGTRCVVVKDLSGTVLIGGTYVITLTVIDSKGASATTALSIKDNAKNGVGCN